MVTQPSQFHLESSGEWVKSEQFIETVVENTGLSERQASKKLDEHIKNRDIEVMQLSTNTYVRYDSAVKPFKN